METFGQFFQKKFPNYKIILLLCIATLAIYANSLQNDFLWDDEEQIVNNQLIRSSENLGQVLFSDPGNSGQGSATNGFYRPLMSLSYFLNFQVWNLNPIGFHLFQLVFHILNVLLVFFVFKKLFELLKIKSSQPWAFIISLFFALHPANTEAVVYLGAVGEVLFAFFVLLATKKILNGVNLERKEIAEKNIWIASLFVFLGMTAKETAIIYFAVALVFIWLFVRPKLKVYINFLTSSFVSVLAYVLLRFFIAGIYFNSNHPVPIAKASFLERLMTIPAEIVTYLKITFWPISLSIYKNFVVYDFSDIKFLGNLVFLVALAIALFWWIKNKSQHKKLSLFFVLWFLLFLLPVLNIFPLNMTLAERWLYLPMLGILGFLAINISPFYFKLSKNFKLILKICLAIILLLMATRVIARNQNWENGLILYGHDITIQKQNANLENNYGVELFRVGKIEEAQEHFEKSVALQNDWSVSQNNLGVIYQRQNNLSKAKKQYQKAMSLSDYYLAYQNYAGVLILLENLQEAKTFLEQEALPRFQTNSTLWSQLALVYYQEQDFSQAQKLAATALSYNPQNQQALAIYQATQQNNQPSLNQSFD